MFSEQDKWWEERSEFENKYMKKGKDGKSRDFLEENNIRGVI